MTYLLDLDKCHPQGAWMQVNYGVQFKKELEQAFKQAMDGVTEGAIIGHTIGQQDDFYAAL